MNQRVCLIVDDEPACRGYLRAVLEQGGIQTLEAENALDALQLLEKRRGLIDLVITDIQMPGQMDGTGLAQAIQGSFPAVPVVLVSGSIDNRPLGFLRVQKPFSSDAMLKAIDKIVPPA